MEKILIEDYKLIRESDFINWSQFDNKSFLITGATGLIGSNLVNCLGYICLSTGLNIHMILLVRDFEEASKRFGWTKADIISYDFKSELILNQHVDYVVHLACPTNSLFFREKPVDTFLSIIGCTEVLLQWAVKHKISKFIYMSSMEVYGFPQKGHKVSEDEIGSFETLNSRNSYPISKIACESLCYSYYSQYGVPVVILRATQTFGPGVKKTDNRVFAQFMKRVIKSDDIVLKSAGLTERSYLYTGDAVSAILVAIMKADLGQAYSVANPDTYCSIKDMAEIVANIIAKGKIKVIYEPEAKIENLGYANTLYMDLDITKMCSLGWKPRLGLKEMFERMIQYANHEIMLLAEEM